MGTIILDSDRDTEHTLGTHWSQLPKMLPLAGLYRASALCQAGSKDWEAECNYQVSVLERHIAHCSQITQINTQQAE